MQDWWQCYNRLLHFSKSAWTGGYVPPPLPEIKSEAKTVVIMQPIQHTGQQALVSWDW